MADELIQGGETAYYRALIQQYDKAAAPWIRRGKKIVKRYVDERADGQVNRLKYNILWSNIENLKPAIYAQSPKPEVERRFLDKDPVGRCAADALERTISYFLHVTPFGSVMRQTRNDYLLVGRGVPWVRYVPTFKQAGIVGSGQVTEDVAPGDDIPNVEEIDYEDVMADYVHWQDFGHNIARTWEEVFCVWRKVYLTRDQMKERGFKDWNVVPLDYSEKELKELAGDDGKKATVYEIWDKNTRKAYWIAKSHPAFLDVRDDPLQLDKFFPCSEPMYATLSNDSLIPIPDYAQYQDQAQELDELTNRIGLMQKAVKAAGVYDASVPALKRLLNEGVENELIPVDSWAAMAEKGGLKNSVELMPMEEIARTLLILYETREKVLADLYQITGLSDLIRGDTKASETATAQQIKSNFINLRLSEKQREMQRLARNTIEIMGNIIARHFTLGTIKRVSGLQLFTEAEKKGIKAQLALSAQASSARPGGNTPAPAQGQPSAPPQAGPSPQQALQPSLPPEIQERLSQPSWEQVYALLQDNPDRCFRISIETDSTVQADEQQQQQEATQFVTAIGGFLQQAQEMAGNPDVAVFLGEMLSWACRRFPISRDLQGTIDTLTEKLAKAAANPQPPKPDPEMAKVEQTGQLEQAKLAANQQAEAARLQSTQQLEQMKAHMADQAEQAKAQREQQMEAFKAHLQAQSEQREAEAARSQAYQQTMMEAQMERFKALLDARTKIEVAEIAADTAETTAQISAANQGAE